MMTEQKHCQQLKMIIIDKHIADRVLTLPMYADLSLEDVDRICDIILK